MLVIIFIGLVAYPQIYRVLLLTRLNKIDFERIGKNRTAKKYSISFQGLMALFVLILIGYLYALSDIFFEKDKDQLSRYEYSG
jgi:hypothetical protein